MILVYDIEWDADAQDADLPQVCEVYGEFSNEAEVIDYLSDEYGWCVKSACVEWK